MKMYKNIILILVILISIVVVIFSSWGLQEQNPMLAGWLTIIGFCVSFIGIFVLLKKLTK